MALGGGNFTAQNKVLPGTYINFVSAAKVVNNLSDRGIVAMPMSLKWGAEGVTTVSKREFWENAFTLFGYDATANEMLALREVFKHATKVHVVRLNTTDAARATNAIATAKYYGERGNDITIKISAEVDKATFAVATLVGTKVVDTQTGISTVADLVSNDWVNFNEGATIAANSGVALVGGTNPTAVVADWTTAFGLLESKHFNILAIDSTDTDIISTAVAYTTRMREEVGNKFQTLYYSTAASADYEGIIELATQADGSKSLVPWAAGLLAGVALNVNCTNAKYDGELSVTAAPTSSQLEAFIGSGKLVLHLVGDTSRILRDINSLVTYTADKSQDFSGNQAVRVVDQYAVDVAALFASKYLGKIPNDVSGRIALWNDIVSIKNELLRIRAIDAFDSKEVVVAAGATPNAVVIDDTIKPIGAMEQLYITVVVQ